MTQEALNIAGQCRATASSPLAKNILVDEGNGLLTELLLDAARIIEALAQPEQIPPSAYSNTHQPKRHELQAKGEHPAPCARHCEANAFQIVIKNLKAQLAQPEQEPVANYCKECLTYNGHHEGCSHYTHPPQRTWVGLTDEEIGTIAYNVNPLDGIRQFSRAIEAKLKEKNT